MKLKFPSIGLLAAILSIPLVSMCSNLEIQPEEAPDLQTYTLSISSTLGSDVKTTITPSETEGKYTATWDAGDRMQIYIDEVSSSAGHKYTLTNPSAGTTANFTGEVGSNEGTHTVYGFYPSSVLADGTDSYDGDNVLSTDLPSTQYPTLTSFDPECDLLAAKPMQVTFTKSGTTSISTARFARKMAILKIIPVDATSSGLLAEDNILSVKITAKDGTTLTGRTRLNLETSEITDWTSQSSHNYATAVYSSDDGFRINGASAAFLMVKPGKLIGGSTISFDIFTDSHKITNNITLPSDITLAEGNVTTLKVKFKDASVYSTGAELPLKEDFSSITTGDNVSTSGSSTIWNGNEKFPDVTRCFQAGGAVRLGAGSNSGSITTKALDLSDVFTVTFKVKGWTKVEGDVAVTAGTQSKTVSYTHTMSGSFESVSASFYGESTVCPVTISTTEGRCFIDDVSIVKGKVYEHAITAVDQITVPASAQASASFTVLSDYGWNATKSEGAGFTFTPILGDGCKQVTVSVSATADNTSTESRQLGTITLSDDEVSKIVTVYQAGKSSSDGWAELPRVTTGANLELCQRMYLPSDGSLRNYSFLFDKTRHCSLWVAWPLHECYLGDASRKNDFGYDPDFIVNDYEADIVSGAYYPQCGSSYSHSRGHQLPSAERTASADDNATTFYATNMTPQLQGFNGCVWEELEKMERVNFICSDTLYIVTGPYFDPDATPTYAFDARGLGKGCEVPTHYWKIFLRTKAGNSGKSVSKCNASELQCVGFWFTHEARSGNPKASDMKSVSDIEALTGFTFFPNVPSAPKSTYTASDWGM